MMLSGDGTFICQRSWGLSQRHFALAWWVIFVFFDCFSNLMWNIKSHSCNAFSFSPQKTQTYSLKGGPSLPQFCWWTKTAVLGAPLWPNTEVLREHSISWRSTTSSPWHVLNALAQSWLSFTISFIRRMPLLPLSRPWQIGRISLVRFRGVKLSPLF